MLICFCGDGQLEALKVTDARPRANSGDGISVHRIYLPPYSPRPPSLRRHSLPTPVHAYFTAFSCPALTQLHTSRQNSSRVLSENMLAKPVVRNSLKKHRRRLSSTSNPQLSETIRTKDLDTDSLFADMLNHRCNYYEGRPTSAPPSNSLQISSKLSSYNSTSTSISQSQQVENRDSEFSHLGIPDGGCDSKSNSSVCEFVSVDEYEAPYLEESIDRISEFCSYGIEFRNASELDCINEMEGEEMIDPVSSYKAHRKSQIYGYTDTAEDSTTLPPIYEIEGEGSEITELTDPPRSVEYWSSESLLDEKSELLSVKSGKTTFADSPNQRLTKKNYCAQYCSDNDSIMSYYSVIPPPDGLRDSIRNVDHLVGKLDLKNVQGCPSPVSPFPLTPPNTCDSSPKLLNVKHPARNNLHALSGVEVK
ncbi:uncharacterized protein [Cherax quadricarinatus]|uniref:uncharacterized protein n=1 Tax=Cherax quadricarinatus TaxID=27406 RepID=UPI00387E4B04